MKKKKVRPGIVVLVMEAKKGNWEIYASPSKKRKLPVTFKDIEGKKYKGLYEFGTRLIVPNGNEVACNPRQFNSILGAKKNIKSVKESA